MYSVYECVTVYQPCIVMWFVASYVIRMCVLVMELISVVCTL